MTKDHAYLYLGSVSEARRQNELALWRASHLENIACKQAIEEAIRRGFDGMHLSHDCARGVIEDFGFKRVGWVLAATIQLKPEDGRFSRRNKEWAAATFIPRSDRNYEFMVESHTGVLDIFVNEFREAQDALGMFTRSHCDDMTGHELEGKVLVMSPFTLKESYWAPENQLWLATGGFGCAPNAAGRAVYATCLGDGEQTRWNRSDFIGILREEHLPDWARESKAELVKSRRISRYDHPNHVSERSLITMATTKKKQQEATTPQVEARIDRLMDGDFKTKAFASATIGGAFAVHGIRVIESDKGRFISMPQESYKKNGETKYNDTFHAITAEARNALVDAVNDAYEQKLQEQQEQKSDAPEQAMSQQM